MTGACLPPQDAPPRRDRAVDHEKQGPIPMATSTDKPRSFQEIILRLSLIHI